MEKFLVIEPAIQFNLYNYETLYKFEFKFAKLLPAPKLLVGRRIWLRILSLFIFLVIYYILIEGGFGQNCGVLVPL